MVKTLLQRLVLMPFRNGTFWSSLFEYPKFFKQLIFYRNNSSEQVLIQEINPQLHDAAEVTLFDAHYFYQSAWCARKINQQKPNRHVDIASQINLIAPLSAFVEVEFIDYRPLLVTLENLSSKAGNILHLPFDNQTVKSLSCLHVIEHIGLGRYGDSLDPNGCKKACKELQRVLGIDGNLYISTPIGKERVEFNAHRIHFPVTILNFFNELSLIDFAYIDDTGNFIQSSDYNICNEFNYGLGMFHFRRTIV